MAEQAAMLTRHDLEAKIVKHCWEDEKFRKEFTADPAGAFVKYLQVSLASLPRISVHQEAPDCWHIVLPAKPASADELSEADLEKIAAGNMTLTALLSALGASTVASAGITVSAGVSIKQGW
jgi:hypothetical protein